MKKINVLGIDGGGTKTEAVLMDENYQILGSGKSGPSNYQSVGIEVAKNSIQSAIIQAVINSNSHQPISGICLGLAGVGRAEDFIVAEKFIQEIITNLPIKWDLQTHTTIICSDSNIALVGGIGDAVGVVVMAGTGSLIFGQNNQGLTKRVGGWGYLLGDEGGGYNIAIQGLQAALKSYDGRESPTTLITDFQTYLGLKNIEGLIEIVYRRGWNAKDVATLAPIVFAAANKEDKVAKKIIQGAIEELSKATKIVISTLFQPHEIFEVVTIGSVWRGMENFRSWFENSITAIAPTAQVIWPRHQPVYGAALLALKAVEDINSKFKIQNSKVTSH
ncbi:BadF/BadG/BcrA/BcrD ATPase family protein [Okeania sp.]|uniref:N-acetylglucosamine kinase n=1 Tax=Okeania sp. TaxID=3100323 RepID=UPI002B4AF0BF|nr:BadF/BadG/BcrA/BcrD ATPase family protein [Okeania sp.]MEB3342949.1 BadF/BadG/BcrA/BcrD ATPase family protein [Okeania sp.]